MVWNNPPSGTPVTTTPFASSFSARVGSTRAVTKARLAARQLVLQFSLDRVLTDGDLGDTALSDELLELAEGNGIDRIVGRHKPLQQQHGDPRHDDKSHGNGTACARTGRISISFPGSRSRTET